jgi:hypothetical protein
VFRFSGRGSSPPSGSAVGFRPRGFRLDDRAMTAHLIEAFDHRLQQGACGLGLVSVALELGERIPLPRDQGLGLRDMPIRLSQVFVFALFAFTLVHDRPIAWAAGSFPPPFAVKTGAASNEVRSHVGAGTFCLLMR